ncbi:MAG: ribonuclease III [Bacteroides sp.]|nr:ribonuclease III [Bacillota bacterium]MCM1393698.1 ribonuclease III [[Eubacterium] siraeum]MCM1456136.1 ribonuclease III [Bacteroides sp.]
MNNDDIQAIESKIDYTFKDKSLLKRAFTHSSASKIATQNYESLEFLGDSILDFIVAKRLMTENPNAHEGALTQRRSEIVSQEPLEKAIEKLDIAKYMVVGKGEKVANIINHTKVKSNLLEAIVGAIYLDSGNIDCAERFILKALKSHFDGSAKHSDEHDYKSELNEFATRNKLEVKYSVVDKSGAPHEPTFVVDVFIDGIGAGRGKGKSKKIAEQSAAQIALKHIGGK